MGFFPVVFRGKHGIQTPRLALPISTGHTPGTLLEVGLHLGSGLGNPGPSKATAPGSLRAPRLASCSPTVCRPGILLAAGLQLRSALADPGPPQAVTLGSMRG